MADGAFEALEVLAEQDEMAAIRERRGMHFLIQFEIPQGSQDPVPRFTRMAASYATARLNIIGACGDPTTTMRLDVTDIRETRRGNNVIGRQDWSHSVEFEVLSRFVDIIRDQHFTRQMGYRGVSPVLAAYEEVFRTLSCDSTERRALEDNLLAYYAGRAPVHVRD